jgi:hypothetical protein
MLEKLKEVYGNCSVPSLYVCDDGTKLGSWVKDQRHLTLVLKDAKFPGQRQEALDVIDLCGSSMNEIGNSSRSQAEYMLVKRIASTRDGVSCLTN